MLPTKDHIKSNIQLQLVKGMAWVTSAIALLIGMLGIMNTMVMTVHERTREIGILRAVGWRPGRVLRLILFEAIVLSQIGALLGASGGVLLLFALARLPATAAMIAGDIQPWLLLLGFLIAAAVGVLGGLLPAWQAARLLPTAALRQD